MSGKTRLPAPRRRTRRYLLALNLLALLGAGLYWTFGYQMSTASTPHVLAESGVVRANVTYCTGDGIDLKMDLYLPPPLTAAPAPVAVYVHGGGWQEGDKNWIDRVLPPDRLVARGYVVAAINYRLAPRHTWPAQIEDAKCAIRYLHAHATTYNLDPARIGVWGESAGGHLAALLGLAGPDAGFEGRGGYPDQSSRVQAVVDMCGPADFTTLDLNLYNRLMAQMLLGTQPDPDLLRRVSPVNYARRDAPPFLILHGDKDPLVAYSNSQHLYDALHNAGAPVTFITVKNSGHVFSPSGGVMSPTVPEIDNMVLDFFDKTLHNTLETTRTFPQTAKTVRGPFLAYWTAQGDGAALGYPVSEPVQERLVDGRAYTVQYFERAALEYHPDKAEGDAVVPRRLGVARLQQKYPAGVADAVPNTDAGSVLFAQTGKRVGGAFLAYWRAHAGASALGDPISDEFIEVSSLDGRSYRVQYFEWAVLEAHPANPAPFAVVPSQPGTLAYRARYLAAGTPALVAR
jgi:acetyl esterase/lipase